MKKIILIYTFAVYCAALHAQAPEIDWKTTYGGSGHDGLAAIEILEGAGFIIAGYTDSADGDIEQTPAGMQDLWLLKTNDTGTILWQKTIGGPNSEMANDIAATPDGGYVIAGQHSDANSSGNYDFLIVKTDGEGNVEWQKILGGTGYETAHGIHPTPDGGYIVAGESNSDDGDAIPGKGMMDFWVLKLSSEGTIEWQKKLGGTLNDGCWSIQLTADGGYALAGVTESNDIDVTGNHGMNDYWLVKLNANGNIVWQKTYGGTSIDYGIVMAVAPDGGYVLSGFAFSNDSDVTGNHGAGDMWVVKTNSTGTIEWQECLGGTNNEVAYDVTVAQDGGYLLGGYAMSADGDITLNQGNADYWVVKLSSTGTLNWQKSLGGTALDYVKGLRETADGGVVVAGNSLSADGDVGSNLGNEDFWVVKLGEETSGINTLIKPVSAYPNPVKNVLYFSQPLAAVSLYGVDGKEISNYNNVNSIAINHLASGLYFARLQTDNATQKITFVKQ